MDREEIVQSKEYIFAKAACKYGDQDAIQAFEDGAEYGYKLAVEKACKFLEECGGYVVNGQKCNYDNFMKAMEEEK